jgi:oxepin-CoA hydrolase/3-oxo-5,6-dehydrosuberyl-CoA semialdehyde dehydrogenase
MAAESEFREMTMSERFDVNNPEIRKFFLYEQLMELLVNLSEQHRPLWGRMTARQMVEHLTRSFEISTGIGEQIIDIPGSLAERRKRFLYDNTPTPHEVPNPLLSDSNYLYSFKSLDEGLMALSGALIRFRKEQEADSSAVHFHPIFGFLNMAEWERAHYKHCYHHLLQFSLIR